MTTEITIGNRCIGPGRPTYVIAELSANHNQSFDQAVRILHAAKDAGVDAVKLQTYTADTITLRSDKEYFRITGGTLWDGRILHDLYQEAFTPWDWQPKLKKIAEDLGMHLFSSAFDGSAVDFLEQMDVPAHKVASCELVDLGLIRKMARTGKPMIMSTGMASEDQISEAMTAPLMLEAADEGGVGHRPRIVSYGSGRRNVCVRTAARAIPQASMTIERSAIANSKVCSTRVEAGRKFARSGERSIAAAIVDIDDLRRQAACRLEGAGNLDDAGVQGGEVGSLVKQRNHDREAGLCHSPRPRRGASAARSGHRIGCHQPRLLSRCPPQGFIAQARTAVARGWHP